MNELVKSLDSLPWVSNQTVISPVAVGDIAGRMKAREKINNYHELIKELAGNNRGSADLINENGLVEYLVNGSYIRQLHIPANTKMVGKIWKVQRLWIIATGEVTFADELGIQRVKAPFVRVVEPNSKTVLHTHKNTLWFAITGTKTEDLSMIQDELFGEIYQEDFQE